MEWAGALSLGYGVAKVRGAPLLLPHAAMNPHASLTNPRVAEKGIFLEFTDWPAASLVRPEMLLPLLPPPPSTPRPDAPFHPLSSLHTN